MRKYWVVFEFSRDGVRWTHSSTFINAETLSDAVAMIKSKYPYVRIINAK